jgi:hypothetical protein
MLSGASPENIGGVDHNRAADGKHNFLDPAGNQRRHRLRINEIERDRAEHQPDRETGAAVPGHPRGNARADDREQITEATIFNRLQQRKDGNRFRARAACDIERLPDTLVQ